MASVLIDLRSRALFQNPCRDLLLLCGQALPMFKSATRNPQSAIASAHSLLSFAEAVEEQIIIRDRFLDELDEQEHQNCDAAEKQDPFLQIRPP